MLAGAMLVIAANSVMVGYLVAAWVALIQQPISITNVLSVSYAGLVVGFLGMLLYGSLAFIPAVISSFIWTRLIRAAQP